MKVAENGRGFYRADGLSLPMDGSILIESAMGPRSIVIGSVFAKNPAQVCLAEHDQLVDTFPSDRADQSLCVPILPWRPRRDRLIPNAHGA